MGRAQSRCKLATENSRGPTNGTAPPTQPIKPAPPAKHLETVYESPIPEIVSSFDDLHDDHEQVATLDACSIACRQRGPRASASSPGCAVGWPPSSCGDCCCNAAGEPPMVDVNGEWYGNTGQVSEARQMLAVCCDELSPSLDRSTATARDPSLSDGMMGLKGVKSARWARKLNCPPRGAGGGDNSEATCDECDLASVDQPNLSCLVAPDARKNPQQVRSNHHQQTEWDQPLEASNRCEQLEKSTKSSRIRQQQQQQVSGGESDRLAAIPEDENGAGEMGRSSLFPCCLSHCLDCDSPGSPPPPLATATATATETTTKVNIYDHRKQVRQRQKRKVNQGSRLNGMNGNSAVCKKNPIDYERYRLSSAVAASRKQLETNVTLKSNNLQHNQTEKDKGKGKGKGIGVGVGKEEEFEDPQAQIEQSRQRSHSNAEHCDAQSGFLSMKRTSYEFIDIGHNSTEPNKTANNDSSSSSELTTFGGPEKCLDPSRASEKLELEQQQQQQQQPSKQTDSSSNNNKDSTHKRSGGGSSKIHRDHMDWQNIAKRYGRMPHPSPHRGQIWFRLQESCFCHVVLSALNFLFPFFTSFGNYNLPADLLTDVISGFTVAILHIPQGMAYGLLAGVEPIHGLYVSLVPVIIMAFMSKSPHMSYGTFAVVSILLANCLESIKQTMRQDHFGLSTLVPINLTTSTTALITNSETISTETRPPIIISQSKQQQQQQHHDLGDALVMTNNHHGPSSSSPDPGPQQQQLLLKNLLMPQQLQQASPEVAGYEDQSIWFGAPGAAAAATATADQLPSNIEILTCICLIAGLIQIAMAIMRLGVLSLVFSDQLVSSFTTASAVHVATSQLGNLFDLTIPQVPPGPFKVCRIWVAFGAKFLDGFNHYTALLSLISLLFLLAIKELIEPRLKRRFKLPTCIPSELILMLALIVCSKHWRLHSDYGLLIVGHVPTDLPVAKAPRLDLVPWVMQDALTVAIVSFAMNLSLARVCAKKFKYSLNSNQELFAIGTSNLISSFFSCFPCASSLSRTAVQSSLNTKSQLCSLVSCAIVVSIICYFAPFFHDLPRSTLSCIIVIALKGILFQARDLYDNWCLSKLDALVWLATFMFVIAFDVTYGLVLGILTSLSLVFYRLITPNYTILGQLPDTEIYVAKGAFVECNEIDHVKIFRFNSALCYLNRDMFKSSIERLLQPTNCQQKQQKLGLGFCSQQKPFENGGKIEYLIIDCSALAFCDYSGASALIEITDELGEKSIIVYLACCSLKLIRMIEKLKRTNLLERNVYPTITDAVNQARYLRNMPRPSSAPPSDSTGHTCLRSVISDTP